VPNTKTRVNRGFAGNRQSGNARKAATGFRCLPLFCRFVLLIPLPVGAAEGCDLLILIVQNFKKISLPAATPAWNKASGIKKGALGAPDFVCLMLCFTSPGK
jgi:hypothetical protein